LQNTTFPTGLDNQSRLVSELDRQLNYSARHSRVAPAMNIPRALMPTRIPPVTP
jgi:hypothetical protein